MHAVDILAVCTVVALLALCAAVLARQRFMLSVGGGIPLAVRSAGGRWVYGIARYAGGELRWYRALGIGTKPSRAFRRGELRIVGHRAPSAVELGSLPAAAVVVDCRADSGTVVLALGEDAFTGLISWIESSSPRP